MLLTPGAQVLKVTGNMKQSWETPAACAASAKQSAYSACSYACTPMPPPRPHKHFPTLQYSCAKGRITAGTGCMWAVFKEHYTVTAVETFPIYDKTTIVLWKNRQTVQIIRNLLLQFDLFWYIVFTLFFKP